MDLSIKKLEEVWTADHQKLGLIEAVYHRLEGVDPDLGYYATYLNVQNFDYGDDFYIPTDFIEGRDSKNGHLLLKTKFITVLENTWNRMPDFIADGQARFEKLYE
jgi:hypothetical protein